MLRMKMWNLSSRAGPVCSRMLRCSQLHFHDMKLRTSQIVNNGVFMSTTSDHTRGSDKLENDHVRLELKTEIEKHHSNFYFAKNGIGNSCGLESPSPFCASKNPSELKTSPHGYVIRTDTREFSAVCHPLGFRTQRNLIPRDQNYCEFSTSSSLQEKNKMDSQNIKDEKDDDVGRTTKDWGALLTVPNFLTVTRMALTPYLGYLVLIESYQLACGVFLFAGVTDLLDGWIARRFPGQSSPVGSFLDPLADKFLVSTLFITLTMVNLIPIPLTALVVARDVSLIAAAFYVRIISLPSPVTFSAVFNISHQTAELKPTFISKLNTAIQLGLIVATLSAPVFNFVDHMALQALWYTTAGTTVLSGIGYIFAQGTFRVFKQKRHKP